MPPIAAKLLYHRGLRTQEQIDEFLHPDYSEDVHDPFLFRDMKKAVEDYKKGKEQALMFLVGQAMRAVKEKSSAEMFKQRIHEKIKGEKE